MKYVPLIGRTFFSLIFLMTCMSHFSYESVTYATAAGVPMASVFVPLSGIIAIAGAVSIILGYKAKMGAWLIIIFLVPVTLIMHRFWNTTDPMVIRIQMVNFMKNLSMLGGALLIAAFGAGPFSIDNRKQPQK